MRIKINKRLIAAIETLAWRVFVVINVIFALMLIAFIAFAITQGEIFTLVFSVILLFVLASVWISLLQN